MKILLIGWAFAVGFLAGKTIIAGADLRNGQGELIAMSGRLQQLTAEADLFERYIHDRGTR